jgi:hypothetical protein
MGCAGEAVGGGCAVTEEPLRRLFSSSYDSVTQRERLLHAARPDPFLLRYRARLRLDAILSGSIVVTDAQLLDGAFFLRQTPDQLMESVDLGAGPQTLTVRTRRSNLAEALVATVTDPDTGLVRPFEFSAIGDDRERQALWAHLQRLAESGTRAPRDLDELEHLLRRSDIAATRLDPVVAAWRRWDEAARSGRVGLECYQDRPLDLGKALGQASKDEVSPEGLRSALPQEAELVSWLQDALLGESPSRSAMYAEIRRRAHDAEARDHLMRWLDKVFGLAFCVQHDCIDFDQEAPAALRPVRAHGHHAGGGRKVDDETLDALVEAGMTAEVRSDFMPRLALLDDERLRDWADDQRDRLAAWRTDGRPRELRHALRELEESLALHVSARRLRTEAGLETPAKPLVGSRTYQTRQAVQLVKRWGGAAATAGAPALAALMVHGSIETVLGAWWFGTAATATIEGGRAIHRRARGNATVITTDIAMARRRQDAGHSE